VFTDPLPRNGRLLILILQNNGRTRSLFRGLCPATGLYATVWMILNPLYRRGWDTKPVWMLWRRENLLLLLGIELWLFDSFKTRTFFETPSSRSYTSSLICVSIYFYLEMFILSYACRLTPIWTPVEKELIVLEGGGELCPTLNYFVLIHIF
jgi:hypothetical protein